MSFNSIIFCFLFLPIAIIIYFFIPKKLKNIYLLIISILFYSYSSIFHTIILLLITIYNFVAVRKMDELQEKRRKYKLIEILIINIFTLCYFKYYYILLDNLFHNLSFKEIILPLGMSFYIFTILSYVIDVYKGKVRSESNLTSFGLYVLFFPKLIMGPIVRYQDFNEQIDHHDFNNSLFHYGFKRFIIGLAMKVVLADTFSRIISLYQVDSMLGSIVIIVLYSMQLYYDFAGYTNMALGLSNIFEFDFRENFHYPYMSKSVGEFFRRWHISLGEWFRDYVYIPLGGSRTTKPRLVINLLIVWLLTGMWHGASYNFILWGIFLGVIIVIEKLVLSKIKIPTFVGVLFTFICISISWIFFFNSDFDHITLLFKNLVNIHHFADDQIYSILSNYLVYLIVGFIALTPVIKNIGISIQEKHPYLYNCFSCIYLLFLILLSTSYMISYSYQPFLYFNF